MFAQHPYTRSKHDVLANKFNEYQNKNYCYIKFVVKWRGTGHVSYTEPSIQ